jgi:hypothetical protein
MLTSARHMPGATVMSGYTCIDPLQTENKEEKAKKWKAKYRQREQKLC